MTILGERSTAKMAVLRQKFSEHNSRPQGVTKEMPSHVDAIDDLQRKIEKHPQLSNTLHQAISEAYDCNGPSEILKKHQGLREVHEGLPVEELLMILKWLFIEQDLTYWLQTGRNMLMSAIEEEVFGIDAPLKG